MSERRPKAKLFREWLQYRESEFPILAPLVERLPDDKIEAGIRNFEEAGYALDKSGIPIGLNDADKYDEIVRALHESFGKVVGYPSRFSYTQKWLLRRFKGWLASVCESAQERVWWERIPWRKVGYDLIAVIADYMYVYGFPLTEVGVPMPLNKEDIRDLGAALEASALKAIVNEIVEVGDDWE